MNSFPPHLTDKQIPSDAIKFNFAFLKATVRQPVELAQWFWKLAYIRITWGREESLIKSTKLMTYAKTVRIAEGGAWAFSPQVPLMIQYTARAENPGGTWNSTAIWQAATTLKNQ